MTSTERKRASRSKPAEPTKDKTVFTTGQVAKFCKVAPRTVSKWFDAGRLKGYRIPGSTDRRIPRDNLVRFLKDHHMPMGDLEEELTTRVLLIGVGAGLEALLRAALPPASGFAFESVQTDLDAGLAYRDFGPDAVVIDASVGRSAAMRIAGRVRQMAGGGDCPLLVALTGEDDADATAMTAAGFDDTLQHPVNPDSLTDRLLVIAHAGD